MFKKKKKRVSSLFPCLSAHSLSFVHEWGAWCFLFAWKYSQKLQCEWECYCDHHYSNGRVSRVLLRLQSSWLWRLETQRQHCEATIPWHSATVSRNSLLVWRKRHLTQSRVGEGKGRVIRNLRWRAVCWPSPPCWGYFFVIIAAKGVLRLQLSSPDVTRRSGCVKDVLQYALVIVRDEMRRIQLRVSKVTAMTASVRCGKEARAKCAQLITHCHPVNYKVQHWLLLSVH